MSVRSDALYASRMMSRAAVVVMVSVLSCGWISGGRGSRSECYGDRCDPGPARRRLPVLPSLTTPRRRRLRGAGVQRTCLLYTSDAADEEDSVDLGGRRIIKKKN